MVTATEVRTITVEWLEDRGACEDQVELFRSTFGDSAEVGREAARKAVAAGLDLDWLAAHLLEATALRACREATAPARRAYEEAVDAAFRACREATAPAWRAYREATAPAWRAYREAMATALCDALGLD